MKVLFNIIVNFTHLCKHLLNTLIFLSFILYSLVFFSFLYFDIIFLYKKFYFLFTHILIDINFEFHSIKAYHLKAFMHWCAYICYVYIYFHPYSILYIQTYLNSYNLDFCINVFNNILFPTLSHDFAFRPVISS